MNTFWVTFYSYKGGVGRTMALTNVAALMAKEGRRVLVIDFDLEAPGLDSFDGLGCAKGSPGVVEYVTEYLQTNRAPDITRFVQECRPAGVHLRGNLWLMGCGKKDATYNRERAAIDWTALYERHDGERFVENWKAAIEQTYRPDYVLIDSRTGLTEVGGICTLHLPQLVVLLYALNDQNIHGVAGVAKALLNPKNTTQPQILTVATPVPLILKERKGLLQERLDFAEKEIGVKPHCQIHYHPRIPLKEEILVWEADDSASENLITREYNRLREKIVEYNPKGLDFLLRELDWSVKELDEDRAQETALALSHEYGDRAESYYAIAQSCRTSNKLAEFEKNLRSAIKLDPYFSKPFGEFISYLQGKNRFDEALDIALKCLDGLKCDPKAKIRETTLRTVGELAMSACKHSIAANAYQELAAFEEESKITLVSAFNVAESRRRAGLEIETGVYTKIIELYEGGDVTEGAISTLDRLNHKQAIHIPYAMLGRVEEAIELLESIQRLAATMSPRDRVFCVSSYTNISVEDWQKENMKMINSLRIGRLWDGSPLPTSEEYKN